MGRGNRNRSDLFHCRLAVVIGIFTDLGAIQLGRVIRSEGWLIRSGILSALFGIFLFFYPGASTLGLILLIDAYAIVFEIMEIILAFRLCGASQIPFYPMVNRPASERLWEGSAIAQGTR